MSAHPATIVTTVMLTISLAGAAPAGEPGHEAWTVPHTHEHEHAAGPLIDVDCTHASLPNEAPLQPVEPFALSATRISANTAFGDAQALNTAYLRLLDLDRLLWTFRTQAGLPTARTSGEPVTPYGGWESPNYQWGLLNGHFTGHLLSALAFTASGSGDATMLAKGAALVAGLAACQDAVGTGWLSAYPLAHLERLEAHNSTHVWAPYYTLQ